MNHRKIRLHHLRYHRNSIALFIGSKCHGWCNIAVLRDGSGLFILRVTNYVAFLQSVPMMLMDSRPTQSANLQRPGPSRPSLVHLRNGIPSSSSQLLDNEATVSFTIYLHNSYVYCVKVLGRIHLALIDGLFCFSFEFSETWWSFNTHWSLRLQMKNKKVFVMTYLKDSLSIKDRWIRPHTLATWLAKVVSFLYSDM